jgi:hypothetical protein
VVLTKTRSAPSGNKSERLLFPFCFASIPIHSQALAVSFFRRRRRQV